MSKLDEYYKKEYKEKLNDYYIELIGNKFINIIRYGIMYFIISLVPSLLYIINIKDNYLLTVIYNLLVWIIYILKVHSKIKKEYFLMNMKVIYDMFKFISNSDFVYKENFQIKENLFKTMDIFNYNLLNYTGSNLIHIPYKGSTILLTDVNLYTYTDKEEIIVDDKYVKRIIKKEKKTRFNGLYVELSLSKNNPCQTYLVPNNINDKYLNKYICYKGEKVLLEDIIFNKKYTVYSSDQIQARYILQIDLMDKINKLDEIIPNKKYIVFKSDQTVGIFICDYLFENIKKTSIPLRRNDTIELDYINNIYNQLNNIFKIYDILDLNEDIY